MRVLLPRRLCPLIVDLDPVKELVSFRQSLEEKVEVKTKENSAVTSELNELKERLKVLFTGRAT